MQLFCHYFYLENDAFSSDGGAGEIVLDVFVDGKTLFKRNQ